MHGPQVQMSQTPFDRLCNRMYQRFHHFSFFFLFSDFVEPQFKSLFGFYWLVSSALFLLLFVSSYFSEDYEIFFH